MVGFRKPHHFDRNRNLREVLIHVTEDIQGYSKFKITTDAKMTLAISRKQYGWYWQIFNPLSQNDGYCFHELRKLVDLYSSIYDKSIFIGDLNVEGLQSCLTLLTKESVG